METLTAETRVGRSNGPANRPSSIVRTQTIAFPCQSIVIEKSIVRTSRTSRPLVQVSFEESLVDFGRDIGPVFVIRTIMFHLKIYLNQNICAGEAVPKEKRLVT